MRFGGPVMILLRSLLYSVQGVDNEAKASERSLFYKAVQLSNQCNNHIAKLLCKKTNYTFILTDIKTRLAYLDS